MSLTLEPATIDAARGAASAEGRSLSSWIDRTITTALRPAPSLMSYHCRVCGESDGNPPTAGAPALWAAAGGGR